MDFRTFLKYAFDTSGLYRAQFAAKINVSNSTLDNYLSGRTQPNYDDAVKIIRATGFHDVQITFNPETEV